MYLTRTSALSILALVAFFALALTQVASADTTHTQHTDNPHHVGSGGSMTMYGHHNASTGNPGWTFLTRLTGAEEVPPVSTQTTGDGGVWFGNNGSGMNAWVVVWKGDDITEAHLHCGDPGENGPPVVDLYHNPNGTDVNGVLTQKNITDSSIKSADCASKIGYNIANVHDLAHAIENGDIYLNVHDKAHPNGVIRGQFKALSHELPGPTWNGGGKNDHDSDDDHDDHSYKHDSNHDSYHKDRDHDSWNKDHSDDRHDSYDENHDRDDHDHGYDGKDGKDGRDGKDGHDGNDRNNRSQRHDSDRNYRDSHDSHSSARIRSSIQSYSSISIRT